MLVILLIILALRLLLHWTPVPGLVGVLLDGALLFFIVTRFGRWLLSLRSWHYWRFLIKAPKSVATHHRVSIELSAQVLHFLSLFFAIFWMWRWMEGLDFITDVGFHPRHLSFLDVFLFCQFFSLLLHRTDIQLLLSRIPLTSGRQILLQYVVVIFVGTLLLMLPSSVLPEHSISLINALFVTISALSVTGLSPIDVGSTLSPSGLVILLCLIQIGGLGVVFLTMGFVAVTRRRLTVNSLLLSREMYSASSLGDIPTFLAKVLGLTFLIEILGAVSLYFSLPSDLENRLFVAVFHAVSAFCNAGFSIYSGSMQEPVWSVLSLVVVCVLIVLGGLGFPIMLEALQIRGNRRGWKRFSIPSQLTLAVMGVLLSIGAILFFLFESVHPASQFGFWERLGQAIFYSISSRTAGFGLVPVEQFQLSTLFWLVLLMIIGANPTSTGGGVKTTTVGILAVTVWRSIRGDEQILFLNRALPLQVIVRALTVFVLYMVVAGLAILILIITENGTPFQVAFEVVSALSTVGLSMAFTGQLSILGKVIIMFLMLFGRIGILAFVLASMGQRVPSKVRYPEETFFIG